MPLFLLSLLKSSKLIGLGIGILACLSIGGYITHLWDESSLESALKEQKTALVDQCVKDKKLTTEASNDYETKITALNKHIADIKRVRPSKCLPIVARNTNGTISSAGGTGNGGENGVDSDALYDYAALAEKYRLQLIGLQNFVKIVWANQ